MLNKYIPRKQRTVVLTRRVEHRGKSNMMRALMRTTRVVSVDPLEHYINQHIHNKRAHLMDAGVINESLSGITSLRTVSRACLRSLVRTIARRSQRALSPRCDGSARASYCFDLIIELTRKLDIAFARARSTVQDICSPPR